MGRRALAEAARPFTVQSRGSLMPKMKAVQVSQPNGPFEVVSLDVRDPGASEIRIRVEACGVCHSDAVTKGGAYPGLTLPRVPGHEIAGRVDAVGASVRAWKPGDRVGVGWDGGHCRAAARSTPRRR
jgi:alcohol dehydrogenase, propanol-preferring